MSWYLLHLLHFRNPSDWKNIAPVPLSSCLCLHLPGTQGRALDSTSALSEGVVTYPPGTRPGDYESRHPVPTTAQQ